MWSPLWCRCCHWYDSSVQSAAILGGRGRPWLNRIISTTGSALCSSSKHLWKGNIHLRFYSLCYPLTHNRQESSIHSPLKTLDRCRPLFDVSAELKLIFVQNTYSHMRTQTCACVRVISPRALVRTQDTRAMTMRLGKHGPILLTFDLAPAPRCWPLSPAEKRRWKDDGKNQVWELMRRGVWDLRQGLLCWKVRLNKFTLCFIQH